MKSLLILAILLSPLQIGVALNFNFVIWDVGQGSWATYIDGSHCLHFDMGGDWPPPKSLRQICRKHRNQVYLSHEDRDHTRFISLARNWWRGVCLHYPRQPRLDSLRSLPPCERRHRQVQVLSTGEPQRGSNQGSIVYLLKGQVVLPGDSYQGQERQWLRRLNVPIAILVLGHHGSQTSSSMALLERAKPKLAVASAQSKRYGHPHAKVLSRLRQKKIPILTTENWGSLYFKLSSERELDASRRP